MHGGECRGFLVSTFEELIISEKNLLLKEKKIVFQCSHWQKITPNPKSQFRKIDSDSQLPRDVRAFRLDVLQCQHLALEVNRHMWTSGSCALLLSQGLISHCLIPLGCEAGMVPGRSLSPWCFWVENALYGDFSNCLSLPYNIAVWTRKSL